MICFQVSNLFARDLRYRGEGAHRLTTLSVGQKTIAYSSPGAADGRRLLLLAGDVVSASNDQKGGFRAIWIPGSQGRASQYWVSVGALRLPAQSPANTRQSRPSPAVTKAPVKPSSPPPWYQLPNRAFEMSVGPLLDLKNFGTHQYGGVLNTAFKLNSQQQIAVGFGYAYASAFNTYSFGSVYRYYVGFDEGSSRRVHLVLGLGPAFEYLKKGDKSLWGISADAQVGISYHFQSGSYLQLMPLSVRWMGYVSENIPTSYRYSPHITWAWQF